MAKSYLRRAGPDDMDLLFMWANDETTRLNAFNQQQIPYEVHQQWFTDKLKSDTCAIFIYCVDEVPIGQIRIDIDNDSGIISYSIDAAHRSRGHGRAIMALLEASLETELPYVKILCARVKKSNITSQRIFERLDYQSVEKDDYYEYKKELLRV